MLGIADGGKLSRVSVPALDGVLDLFNLVVDTLPHCGNRECGGDLLRASCFKASDKFTREPASRPAFTLTGLLDGVGPGGQRLANEGEQFRCGGRSTFPRFGRNR